ncbi:ribonuclease P protein subunit p40-like [Diorhabda sublineata]|uniref:ribonuclease P protein subunit p40-like n=1 Tax=Diorhabda sublineata TaxID=1163346 RepID=UPI0024E114C6|nr:ribonuclease P protein subunit p40-like [Diorhabda sublineata]
MEIPEVYNFLARDSLLTVEKFEGHLPFNNITINNFHYNHLVSIITPEEIDISKIKSDLETGIYYMIHDLQLQELTNIEFISSFIRNGTLTLLNVDERIDCDNCISITSDGKLYMNLDKDTYQSLGIEGIPSHFTNKLKNRYIVNVDLTEDNLLNNKSKLEKLKSCLQIFKKIKVIVIWEAPDEEVCPSSIAKYFADLGYRVQQCSSTFNSFVVNTKIPVSNITNWDKDETLEFIEWLGMLMLDCNLEPDVTNYLSSYSPPYEHGTKVEKTHCLKLQGFFSSTFIQQILKRLCNINSNKWVAVYVQGFSDCPVTWGSEEQHYFTNGDNGYILIFNTDGGLICTYKCSRKRYK